MSDNLTLAARRSASSWLARLALVGGKAFTGKILTSLSGISQPFLLATALAWTEALCRVWKVCAGSEK